jgi:hypothetical protein
MRLALVTNSSKLAALILKFVLNGNIKSKFNILYFSKPIFADDMNSIKSVSKEITYQKFPVIYLTIIVKYFIPNVDTELNDVNYHLKITESNQVDRLRHYLFRFFKDLNKINKFHAVMTGNFVYTQQQEMFVILKQLNIPSIVLYKEGMMPLEKLKTAKDFLYKTKVFRPDFIFFYNNLIRETVVNSNIPGLTKLKTRVVGIPRFDKYYNYKKKPVNNSIVLFSFEPYEKGNYLVDDKSNMHLFIEEVTNFHKILADYCINNKKFNLIVKTKSSNSAVNFAKFVFEQYQTILGPRLVISNSLNTEELIKDASYIAGFSSTTLIEGLLLSKTLICPKFNPLIVNKENDLLHPYQAVANYVNSLNGLVKVLDNDNTTVDSKFKIAFINERVYKNDGKSSIRVYSELSKILESRSSLI